MGWMTRNDIPSFDLGTYVVSICFDPHGELGPGTGSSNDFGAMDFAEAGCYCGRTQCTDCALSAVSTQSNLQSHCRTLRVVVIMIWLEYPGNRC